MSGKMTDVTKRKDAEARDWDMDKAFHIIVLVSEVRFA